MDWFFWSSRRVKSPDSVVPLTRMAVPSTPTVTPFGSAAALMEATMALVMLLLRTFSLSALTLSPR